MSKYQYNTEVINSCIQKMRNMANNGQHTDCFFKPPRKAYSLTSSAFIAFGALYPFSLFKPVFRGSRI